jgi:hypothetical protein
MTDNTELQRLTRIRRLGRQIAAGLPGDLDLERAFGVHGHVREVPGGPRQVKAPSLEQGSASSGAGGGDGELPRTGYTLPTGRPAGARSY